MLFRRSQLYQECICRAQDSFCRFAVCILTCHLEGFCPVKEVGVGIYRYPPGLRTSVRWTENACWRGGRRTNGDKGSHLDSHVNSRVLLPLISQTALDSLYPMSCTSRTSRLLRLRYFNSIPVECSCQNTVVPYMRGLACLKWPRGENQVSPFTECCAL